MLNSVPLLFSRRPTYYLFHVTSKCNAACSHCFYWDDIVAGKEERDISFEAIEKLSDSMGKILVMNLCGAEAFIRQDITEIAHLFASRNQARLITIPSNGYLSDKIVRDAEQMLKQNQNTFFRFAFSVDGPAEIHDQIRGVPGLFLKVTESIHRVAALKEKYSNFVVLTSTVFSYETQDYILTFLDWIKENLPVQQTNVTFVRGNPKEAATLEVDPIKYDQVMEKVRRDASLEDKDKKMRALIPYSMFLNTMETIEVAKREQKRVFNCFAGEKFVVIGRQGNVYPCEILDESKMLGNLNHYDWNIGSLLKSKQAKSVVDWISKEECACTWECAIQASKFYDPKQWPRVVNTAVKVAGDFI